MFIHCKKNLHIQEGSESLNLKNGFIGEIDDRWAKHWYIKAAISDGTIETAETTEKSAEKSVKTPEKSAKKGKKPAAPEDSGEASAETTEKTAEKSAE